MRARLVLVGLLACATARATIDTTRPPRSEITGTTDEVSAWWVVQDGFQTDRWVRARELGERIVKEHPDSFAGHFVLGVAMHYGEGDLARSAWHLELAKKLFEAKYGRTPRSDEPWKWHESTLRELAYTYGEMDRPNEELAVFDGYDRAYSPPRWAQRVWPLMKLRRYDEARKMAARAVASNEIQQRIIARSDLCAAECEAGSREKAYQACTAALDEYRKMPAGGQVEFSNASEAALSVFKYDEAERFLHESTRRAQPDSWGNPFQHLATLYLLEARIPEAIEALKGGQQLRLRRAAWLDQHGQARLDGTLAELLLVVGQTERAAQIAQRSVDRPDRQGTQSGTEAQADAASALRLSVALRELSERDLEQAAAAPLVESIELRAKATEHRLASWRERRRAAVLLADENFLVRSIRPYYVGGIDLPTYLFMELVEAVGPAVALKAIAKARDEEKSPQAVPFFDALEAEAEFARGHYQSAGDAGNRALEKLPAAEALLRGRVLAIVAESARRRGDLATADRTFAAAMLADPGVLRRLEIALPVRIENDGSDVGKRVARALAASPRLSDGDGKFRVVVSGGAHPAALLLGPSGERIASATVDDKLLQKGTPGQIARALADEANRAFFAIKANLSQADLTTLDGSPTAQRADQQVNQLLDQMGPDASP